MSLCVQNVLAKSLAAKAGIKSGDIILSINANPIHDFLDLQYHSSELALEMEMLDTSGKAYQVSINRDSSRALGIEPEAYHCRFCQNRCIFCFIDQMPPDLRGSLYQKDDDFLYSFVFGNYITLTNLRADDFQRIVKQRISPLYVSVHTTDSGLRKSMMRYRQDIDLLAKLRQLSAKGIDFHFQIVIVPEYNDGETLKETIRTLLHPKLRTLSIGLVPVGLTKFREDLTPLKAFDKAKAQDILDIVTALTSELKSSNIYCADEIFVLSGNPIPPQEYYEDYPQLENGIGMLRLMMENFRVKKRSFLRELRKNPLKMVFVTALSASKYIEDIAKYINTRIEGELARVQVITNNFMGTQITVSGLLTFKDIKEQLDVREGEFVIFPNNLFNYEGITLDGLSQVEIKAALGTDVMVIDHLFEYWDWI